MGRKADDDIISNLAKRLKTADSTAQTTMAEPTAPLPTPAKKRARDDLKFVGFHTTDEQKEKLRVLSFETRKQNQELMREALDLLFAKHGMN